LNYYPFTSAFILNDATFSTYGGDIALGTAAQRSICYWLAEKKVSENLNTFLKPVTITGTYSNVGSSILLENSYVNWVSTVRFIDTEETVYFTASGTSSQYFSLRNDVYGILDIHYLVAHCSSCHNHGVLTYPYQVQVVYNAGLPTGTSTMPDVLLALSTYAKLMLNELIGYGNEAPGDVGVEEYSSQQYREVRRLQNTDFGNSPQAIFVNKQLRSLRKHRYVGM